MADDFDGLSREQLIAELRLARAGLKRLLANSPPRSESDDDVTRVELEAQSRHIRELHEALESARAHQSALYDSAPVALVTIDSLGRIKQLNLAAAALLGRDPARLVGRSLTQYMSAEPGRRLRVAVSLASREPVGPLDVEVVSSTGSVIPVRVIAQRVPPALESPDLHATLALIEVHSAARSTPATEEPGVPSDRAVLAALRDLAVFVVDSAGTIVTWSDGAERVLGYATADVVRKPASILAMDDDLDDRATERERAAALQGRTVEVERWFARKDGSRVWLAGSCGPLGGGNSRMAIYSLHDETDRRMTNEERERLLRNEQRAREQAENANRTKDEFLARVSHELRTPLSAMNLWIELIADTGKADASTIAALERAVHAETRIVDDLLDISRGLQGKLRMRPERVDLVLAIETTIDSMEPQATQQGVTIELHAPEDLWLVGDLGRLQQAFANVISNAIKFSFRGGHIDVVIGCRGDDCLVRVRDEGQGIAPTFLPRVFEPFAQSGATATSNATGLGLGLAIVKQIVELHGGAVTAESAGVGLGSTFTLRIPLRGMSLVEHPASPAKPAASVMGIHALVIEDEASVREALTAFLERHGIRVDSAASAAEAWARMQRECPDLILCDVQMPGEDGLSLIRRMREAESKTESVPIPAAAITAKTAMRDRAAAIAAGFQAYLTKPLDTRELMDTISRLAPKREAN